MEKWKTINNHPNWQVSNIGGLIRNKKTKEIKSTHVHNNGYPCVSLDGKSYLIHKLVAEAFVPNPENKPCVDHIDGNKANADATNLRWATYHENNSNPATSWKNAHFGVEPWNKGITNPYSEEALAKMRDGSIKGGATMYQKSVEKRESPEWERIEQEYLQRQRELQKEWYAENKVRLNAEKNGMTIEEYLQWKEERAERSRAKKEAHERAQARKQWVKEHPEEEKERKKAIAKAYQEKNKEEIVAKRKAYRLAHLEEIRAKDRERKRKKIAD